MPRTGQGKWPAAHLELGFAAVRPEKMPMEGWETLCWIGDPALAWELGAAHTGPAGGITACDIENLPSTPQQSHLGWK